MVSLLCGGAFYFVWMAVFLLAIKLDSFVVEAVLWLKDRREVTLKRFYQEEGGRVRLQPANPTMRPIYIDDPRQVQVQGKVVMVIRQLR
jgi:phage repressor protein C with HTH and peptisase S24 domain